MSHERISDAISQLQAHDGDPCPAQAPPQERYRWAEMHRRELHIAQEAILAEIEDVWHIQQVASGEIHGA